MTQRIPVEVFPPGEFLKDELEAREWSQSDLAAVLGRDERLVSEIISGKRAITPETARGLASAFGTTPNLWMNLESTYRLSKTVHADDEVRRRATLFGFAPIKELIRRGWIEASDSIEVLEERVRAFFGVTSFDEPLTFQGAARSSTETRTPAQCAWLIRAKQMAASVSVGKFVASRIGALIEKLRSMLANREDVRHVPKTLADFGIRMVIVEPLAGTRIDGACFWLDEHSPAIALSMRYDKIDTFWFTLLHEIGHVKNGDGKGSDEIPFDIDLVGDKAQRTETKSDRERAADEFASVTLISDKEIRSFIARIKPLYSKTKIVGFAARIGVHPGIVVGRLQYMGEISYAHNKEMLAKVRSVVIPSTLTDGWKSVVAA